MHKKRENNLRCFLLRAENETRTRDPNLGKVMLYQLSYFRVHQGGCFPFLRCKVTAFF